jgi:succinyl-diaminopimelate desuccinylase
MMTRATLLDPLPLAQEMIRCPSIYPDDAGCLQALAKVLGELGFDCQMVPAQTAEGQSFPNLYAKLGHGAPHLCFLGHSDVVPPGDLAAWSADPFAAQVTDGKLMGRGVVDMKGGIAAFVAAAARLLDKGGLEHGSLSILIAGDEETGRGAGTKALVEWAREWGEVWDWCLVGEPSNPSRLGQGIKIGRRGSLCGRLSVSGVQGHSAYPDKADNPVHKLLKLLDSLTAEPLDTGNESFQPSDLQITSVDVGNQVFNLIPAQARAMFNVRFNTEHSAQSLQKLLRRRLEETGLAFELTIEVHGEAYLCQEGRLSRAVGEAVARVTGLTPELSTVGGFSDGRFIKDYCPVVEFGLISQSAHQVDEWAEVEDLEKLTQVYELVLQDLLATSS